MILKPEFIIAIIAGLITELFFRSIRYYSDIDVDGPNPKYVPYNNYITVSEYISGGNKRWLNYLLFRNLPPLIIFTFLTSLYQKYFGDVNINFLLGLAAIVSLIPRDIYQITRNIVPVQEKVVHIINCLTVFSVAFVISISSRIYSFGFLAPSLSGLVDNVWSTLLVAILVVFYWDITKQQTQINQTKQIDDFSNYVTNSYNTIKAKYGKIILSTSLQNRASEPLLYAILIYENMNRPEFVRKLENLIVKFLKVKLTVGIAQVKSTLPMSDEKSIIVCSKIIKNTTGIINNTFNSSRENYQPVREIVNKYNPDIKYIDSIIQILSLLRRFAPNLY